MAILRDMARALAYAPVVVHRDIKPDNVPLTGGAAGLHGPRAGVRHPVDQRTDLYAWGLVAYQVLSGIHPFAGKETAQQLVAAHLPEAPRDLHDVRPVLLPALMALVMRCGVKEPGVRSRSVSELIPLLVDDPRWGALLARMSSNAP